MTPRHATQSEGHHEHTDTHTRADIDQPGSTRPARRALRAPRQSRTASINQAGGPLNDGNNYCQTLLDDAATASIQDVLDTDAPFTGTFSPASPESAFSGETADGTWVLSVSDNALFDTGSVRAFSIDVSGFSCTP